MIVKKYMLSFLIATSLLLGACSPSADESGATESYLGTEEKAAGSTQTSESTQVKDEDRSEVSSSNQIGDAKEQFVTFYVSKTI